MFFSRKISQRFMAIPKKSTCSISIRLNDEVGERLVLLCFQEKLSKIMHGNALVLKFPLIKAMCE